MRAFWAILSCLALLGFGVGLLDFLGAFFSGNILGMVFYLVISVILLGLFLLGVGAMGELSDKERRKRHL